MKYIEELLAGEEVKWMPLGEVCTIKTGKGVTKKDATQNGKYPIISGGKTPMDYIDIYNRPAKTVTVQEWELQGSSITLERIFILMTNAFQ